MSAVKRSELQQTRRLEEAKRAAQILEEEWPDFETLKQQTYQQKEKLTPIPERVWALCNVGRQLSQGGGGEIERARRFLEEAVELQKTYVGDENHPGMLFVYETLCNLLENVPDWEQNAKEIRIQMFEILVKISERYREQSDFLSSVILMQDILQDYEIYIGQYYPPFQKVVVKMSEFWKSQNYGCKIVSKSKFGPQGFLFLESHRIVWEDPTGGQHVWEYVSRPKYNGNPAVSAVAIYARIVKKDRSKPLIPLVMQYRPPVNAITVELPAGVIDEGESVSQAALRELKEETGLVGEIVDESQTICHSPGHSCELFKIVTIDVDGDLPQNKNPKQQLDSGEFIHVEYVEEDQLLNFVKRMSDESGYHIVGYLYGLAFGVNLQQQKSKIEQINNIGKVKSNEIKQSENQQKISNYESQNQSENSTLLHEKNDEGNFPFFILDRGVELSDIIGQNQALMQENIEQTQKQNEQTNYISQLGIAGIGAVVGCIVTVCAFNLAKIR
eukprot:TRINITY_DN3869_c1_g2_i1.p1 TRINITY_DN3869_c1_g2~~TRINITY_DN3869_c1_g2_i1.p1  ORF type:complete len:501 (-),score=92.41 TRINITY_DN3869_c1_g2_i1:392-1894(-)